MRILLLGAHGQLGRSLAPRLAVHGELLAPPRAELELTDLPALRQRLRALRPQLVVNAAAWTAVEQAEHEEAAAFAANAAAPGVLAEECAALGAWLLHAQHGDVLMCNPATAMVPGDAIAAARCNEYQVLASEWFGGLLERLPLRIGPLSRWLREARQTR